MAKEKNSEAGDGGEGGEGGSDEDKASSLFVSASAVLGVLMTANM